MRLLQIDRVRRNDYADNILVRGTFNTVRGKA